MNFDISKKSGSEKFLKLDIAAEKSPK